MNVQQINAVTPRPHANEMVQYAVDSNALVFIKAAEYENRPIFILDENPTWEPEAEYLVINSLTLEQAREYSQNNLDFIQHLQTVGTPVPAEEPTEDVCDCGNSNCGKADIPDHVVKAMDRMVTTLGLASNSQCSVEELADAYRQYELDAKSFVEEHDPEFAEKIEMLIPPLVQMAKHVLN